LSQNLYYYITNVKVKIFLSLIVRDVVMCTSTTFHVSRGNGEYYVIAVNNKTGGDRDVESARKGHFLIINK